ncbi:MAG: hypothetical protein ACRD3G_19760, partial [Vicinamibacterales bacterium]
MTAGTAHDKLVERYEGLGVVIKHDPLRRQTAECDSVMPILHEEHVVTWSLLGDTIISTIDRQRSAVEVDFLDVGTGSGIWTILVARALQRRHPDLGKERIVAVDKVPRMIFACRENLRLNLIEPGAVRLVEKPYAASTVTASSTGAIFMNPPYHLYPRTVENRVPYHARGGSWGFREFERWLKVANEDLADEATIFFHHMCLGDESGPLWETFIPKAVDDVVSIVAHDILPPYPTRDFLTAVYRGDHAAFVEETSRNHPWLYFSSGQVT